jgi:hypothetical protein
VVPLFNPSSDLVAIQNILKADAALLMLLNLTGKTQSDIVKKIIRKSKWDDLMGNERRLCFYFRPARMLSNLSFTKDIIEVDCHISSSEDIFAYQVLERVHILLNKKEINNRPLYFEGQLGELPTMSGFFCVGSRYSFCRNI